MLIVVGKTRIPYIAEGEADFLKRLKRYCRIEIQTVKDKKINDHVSSQDILRTEGSRILKRIPPDCVVVALDRQGQSLSSEDLAQQISDWQNRATQVVTFIIGGPLGLSEDVRTRADLLISISKMTLTHEMTRLIFLEQLYRCYTIIRGENYHK